MSTIAECLRTIVGLSPTTCPCLGSTAPADYNTSKSGLYMTGSQYSVPLSMPKNQSECGEGDGWDMLERARTLGIQTFVVNFTSAMRNTPYRVHSPWQGYMAEREAKYVLLEREAICGAVFMPKRYQGAKFVIHSVQLWVDQPGVYTVEIYKGYKLQAEDYTPEDTITVTVSAGRLYGEAQPASPIEIDLSGPFNQETEVYVLYTRGTANPRNNRFDCGCGNERPWENYFKGYGVHGSDLEAVWNDSGQDYYPNGIVINGTMSCGMDWLCQDWQFGGDPWADTMADTVNLYCIQALVKLLLQDTNINSEVYFNRDELLARGDQLETLITNRLPWLVGNIPALANDCIYQEAQMKRSDNLI